MLVAEHETKANVAPIPYTRIVSAFGVRKCPKLVEQVADEDIEVRVNALAVLCDEFQSPYSIQGCAEAGIVPILAQMITDPDYTTRERASRALATAAADALGLDAILAGSVPDILLGVSDPTLMVRSNVYECIHHMTRTPAGVDACVAAGAAKSLVGHLTNEDESVQAIMLKTIQNLVKTERGLTEVAVHRGVSVCIAMLSSPKRDVLSQAAKTLGFVCFSDKEKEDAIKANGVPILVGLLDRADSTLRAAVTTALMAITSVDEGKRQVLPCGGIPVIIRTLSEEENKTIVINTLKIISNCAVFPPSRALFCADESFLAKLDDLNGSEDPLLRKHTLIAINAVHFKP